VAGPTRSQHWSLDAAERRWHEVKEGPLALGHAPTIGFVTDWLHPGYQEQIWRGTLAAARDREVNVVCLVAGIPGSDVLQQLNNPLYDLAATQSLDGAILIASTLIGLDAGNTRRFLDRFRGLPLCSIAVEVAGASSVVIDNDAGIASAVHHVVHMHGYRNIGFIRGPESSPEAERRFEVFCSALTDHSLEVNEQLILPGDFTAPGGERAASILLDQRRVSLKDVDCIIAANDGMAISFMEALFTRGYRVPNDVALVGFDDIAEAKYARSPLTTVRQPITEEGIEALRSVLGLLRSETTDRLLLNAELVVRRSCGCYMSTSAVQTSVRDEAEPTFGFDAMLVSRRQKILAELLRAARGGFSFLGSAWEARLLAALSRQVRGDEPGAFREAVEDALRRIAEAGVDPAAFQDALTVLWQQVAPCTLKSAETRSRLEIALDDARLDTSAAALRMQAANWAHNVAHLTEVVRVASALSAARSLDGIAARVQPVLAGLGMRQLDLALLANSSPEADVERILTVTPTAVDRTRVLVRKSQYLGQLLQGGSPAALYVAPLGLGPEIFGFVAFQMQQPEYLVCDALRGSLSAAVANLQLLKGISRSSPDSG